MERIEPKQLFEEMSRDRVYLVDARGDTSFQTAREHIPGDLHYSLRDLQTMYRRIPQDSYIVTYCATPNEDGAARVASFLESKGYRADLLGGGLDAWKRAGLPTEPLDAGIQHTS